MAASKKTTKKKVSAAPSKAVKKTTTSHRSHKTTSKKASSSNQPYRTLKAAAPAQPFLSFKFTRQTLYWTILIVFILIIQVWILNVQYSVMQSIDNLNSQTQETVVAPLPKVKK